MTDEFNNIDEISFQLSIEKEKLRKLNHGDSVFTINYINESRDNIIKFDQTLGRTKNLIVKKIRFLQIKYNQMSNDVL
tara:strand:- start:26840 stop:27073 length:234 start_codon:yes stop_codon:yes gene_type:complete